MGIWLEMSVFPKNTFGRHDPRHQTALPATSPGIKRNTQK